MSSLAGRPRQDPWLSAALALAAIVLSLLVLDTVSWHPGYAHGDETDIIARVQRVREGMPLGWQLAQGSLHRALLLGSMSLWPGRLWASSVPAILGLGLEMALLFVLGRRWAGSRAGFLAVFFGAVSAFTLVRARVALSLSLFPAEWLLLVWLRPYASKPWQWLAWGLALGLCCFDYEAWLPSAALLLCLPFPQRVGLRQRAWELAGLMALLLCTLPLADLAQYIQRRQAASFVNSGSPSAGWQGLDGLLGGGPALPFMAPDGHGVLPWWYWVLAPLGLLSWRERPWVPLLYLGLGIALPLMGGAPYGLPAHRAIAAWPVWALMAGLGAERLAGMTARAGARALLGLGLALVAAQQLWAWQDSQQRMDQDFRGRTREMGQAATAAWQYGADKGFPLVTELQPMTGAAFRFLTGHAVSLPDAGAATVVAFVPWDYLPAVRKHWGQVATFQEAPGVAPVLVMVLNGALAAQALEAERSFRPLLLRYTQGTPPSGDGVFQWLRQNPGAGPWARTLALDYVGMEERANARVSPEWVLDVQAASLVSARPLLRAAEALSPRQPDLALIDAHKARELDPYNRRAWIIEGGLLQRLGQAGALEALEKAQAPYEQHGLLFAD